MEKKNSFKLAITDISTLVLLCLTLWTSAVSAQGKMSLDDLLESPDKPFTVQKYAPQYRPDISDNLKNDLRQRLEASVFSVTIHSDWIMIMEDGLNNGKAIDLEGNNLFPNLSYSIVEEIYPDLFVIYKYIDNASNLQMGLFKRDGTSVIPFGDYGIVLDKYGIINVNDKKNDSMSLYTYKGHKICTLPSKEGALTTYKYDNKHQLILTNTSTATEGINLWHLFYLDGTEVIPSFEAYAAYFSDDLLCISVKEGEGKDIDLTQYDYQTHSAPYLNRDEFILPIRDSFVENNWIKLAAQNCDEKKWEEALYDLYYFNEVEMKDYMSNVPETMMYASMWLRCMEALGQEDIVRDNFSDLISYNLSFNEEYDSENDEDNYEISLPFPDETADSDITESLLDECKRIALPILVPDYEKIMAEREKKRIEKEKAIAKAKRDAEKEKRRAERREMRETFWRAMLMGFAQAVNDMAVSSIQSYNSTSYQNTGYTKQTIAPNRVSSNNNGSSSNSSSSSYQPTEMHIPCGVCDNSGYVFESRIKGPDVKKKCSACGGRGYKIRYK